MNTPLRLSYSLKMRRHDPHVLAGPKHLVVEVTGLDRPLIDAPLHRMTGRDDIWHCDSDEVLTPGSLPLWVSLSLGAKSGLEIWSAKTRLLRVGLADTSLEVELLLPTEEKLRVWIDTRPAH